MQVLVANQALPIAPGGDTALATTVWELGLADFGGQGVSTQTKNVNEYAGLTAYTPAPTLDP